MRHRCRCRELIRHPMERIPACPPLLGSLHRLSTHHCELTTGSMSTRSMAQAPRRCVPPRRSMMAMCPLSSPNRRHHRARVVDRTRSRPLSRRRRLVVHLSESLVFLWSSTKQHSSPSPSLLSALVLQSNHASCDTFQCRSSPTRRKRKPRLLLNRYVWSIHTISRSHLIRLTPGGYRRYHCFRGIGHCPGDLGT